MSLDIKTIPDRNGVGDWLNAQGLTGIAVEIGVMSGMYSEVVLERWKGQRFYMVDCWCKQDPSIYREKNDHIDYEGHFQQAKSVEIRNAPIAKIIRALSVEASQQIEDASLDWVYIDGNHAYGPVLDDIVHWYPKLKPGGLLSGHDCYNDINYPHWCEVKRAVEHWTREQLISFVTTPCSSWWTLKPNPS